MGNCVDKPMNFWFFLRLDSRKVQVWIQQKYTLNLGHLTQCTELMQSDLCTALQENKTKQTTNQHKKKPQTPLEIFIQFHMKLGSRKTNYVCIS